MISHKLIANLIADLESGGADSLVADRLWAFLGKYNLENLVEKSLRVLDVGQKEKSDFETLIVRTPKASLHSEVLANIKKNLAVSDEAKVLIEIDPQIETGFLACYRGRMFDARLERLTKEMSKSLKENFEN